MYTRHGHWFAPAVPGEPSPTEHDRNWAPCGGPLGCSECGNDVRAAQASSIPVLGVLSTPAPPVVPLSAAPQPGVLQVPVDELKDWYQRYLELKDAEKKIKDKIDEARTMFLDALNRRHTELPDKVDMTIGGKPVLKRTVIVQNRVDTTRLRADHPALAARYNKVVRQERLDIL